MSSRDFYNPNRYDFKVEYLDYDQAKVQRVHAEFGQYVSFDAYWNLLAAFSDYEDSQQEWEED